MAFDAPVDKKQAVQKDFEAYPPSCRCGKTTALALATVVNKNTGAIKTGAASEFCGRGNDNRPNWVLQDWYSLQEYRGYCTDCMEGLKPSGKRRFSDDDVRQAWRWMMGEICKDAKGDVSRAFKPIHLSDDHRDRAIEIVNHEAIRTHQPDSVPDRFKIDHMWVN
jgi:hypothetical protein